MRLFWRFKINWYFQIFKFENWVDDFSIVNVKLCVYIDFLEKEFELWRGIFNMFYVRYIEVFNDWFDFEKECKQVNKVVVVVMEKFENVKVEVVLFKEYNKVFEFKFVEVILVMEQLIVFDIVWFVQFEKEFVEIKVRVEKVEKKVVVLLNEVDFVCQNYQNVFSY